LPNSPRLNSRQVKSQTFCWEEKKTPKLLRNAGCHMQLSAIEDQTNSLCAE
jgi:hypothetical protein